MLDQSRATSKEPQAGERSSPSHECCVQPRAQIRGPNDSAIDHAKRRTHESVAISGVPGRARPKVPSDPTLNVPPMVSELHASKHTSSRAPRARVADWDRLWRPKLGRNKCVNVAGHGLANIPRHTHGPTHTNETAHVVHNIKPQPLPRPC